MKNEIEIKIANGKIISSFVVLSNADGNLFSCYIPGFDIYFSTDSKTKIETRAGNMITSFYNYWIKKEGNKPFFLELHKLGFRTEKHNFTLKELLNNKRNSATFGSNVENVPNGFENLNNSQLHSELVYV